MKKILSLLVVSSILLSIVTVSPVNHTYADSAVDAITQNLNAATSEDYGIADIVEGEVLALADSYEHSLKIAEMYSLELKSFSDGLAVFNTPNPAKAVALSETDMIVRASGMLDEMFEESSPLPKLGFNYTYTVCGENSNSASFSARTDYNWHHFEMNNQLAWDTSTGSGATIAIIDTGINIFHNYFRDSLSPKSYNSQDQKVGLLEVADFQGHGTHVAGIAAGNNLDEMLHGTYTSMSGVAPDAKLLIIKASTEDTNIFQAAAVIRGINYAVENGADVINLSLGRPYEYGPDSVEYATIKNAVDQGVVVVAAAGNDSAPNVGYPAAYSECIAVSATKNKYEFDSRYSNFGPQMDIAAPGTAIWSADFRNNSSYTSLTGTSMATPNVAGTVALIKSANPHFTREQTESTLLKNTRNYTGGKSLQLGYGIVDSGKAVYHTPRPIAERDNIFVMDGVLEILMYMVGTGIMTDEQIAKYNVCDDDGLGILNMADVLYVLKVLVNILPVPEPKPVIVE